jgi:spermidine synthase
MTDTTWHYENFEPAGSAIGYRITRKLDEVQSPFQKIEIYESTDWGNLMLIDGAMMLTTRDNFLYHEMMSHPALFTHRDPKNVVIIGGGDCGTLREVLKHPGVTNAVQCDIDEQVTRMSEKWFPELCDANHDPRAELMFDDGIAYMANCAPNSLDIVIVDSTDPVGPAEGLFNKAFYASCFRALKDDGILVQQSESPLVLLDLIKEMRTEMGKAGFASFRTLPFRLVERDAGEEVRRLRVPRRRCARENLRDQVLQRRYPSGRVGLPAVRGRSAGRINRSGPNNAVATFGSYRLKATRLKKPIVRMGARGCRYVPSTRRDMCAAAHYSGLPHRGRPAARALVFCGRICTCR